MPETVNKLLPSSFFKFFQILQFLHRSAPSEARRTLEITFFFTELVPGSRTPLPSLILHLELERQTKKSKQNVKHKNNLRSI